MLVEKYIASTASPSKVAQSAFNKDVAIQIHRLQPHPALLQPYKKSSTDPNNLVVTSTHIIAAQQGKAVVHVYSREKGGQEAIVAFSERVTSLAFAGEEDEGGVGVLIMGTEEGRCMLWEVATGRQITTPASHLQSVDVLAVSRDSTYLLSGSADSNIHVWSLPALLSFSESSDTPGHSSSSSTSPLHTLSAHRAAITALEAGHSTTSSAIAISAARDSSCIVWNISTGELLRTFLLPSSAISLAIDPCDRACYAGFEDGSIQLVDFFAPNSVTSSTSTSDVQANPLFDPSLQAIPTQALTRDHWQPPSSPSIGACLALSLSYDGTSLLCGHSSGRVSLWDIPIRRFSKVLADLGAPVTNLQILPVEGFPYHRGSGVRLHQVVKPRYEESPATTGGSSNGIVPATYTFTAQFTSTLPSPSTTSTNNTSFISALHHPSFPADLLTQSLRELFSSSTTTNAPSSADDSQRPGADTAALHAEVAALRSSKAVIWEKLLLLTQEKAEMMEREEGREAAGG
ncbi:MAG: Pre-rRNA-processing protein ipi3 [Caeruleum heppii]|nr:MAG: Pre-rRNA-processing protein ipi3 [Caeruleum heppii]